MNRIFTLFAVVVLAASIGAPSGLSAETSATTTTDALNTVCPVSGKPARADITWAYEGRTYAFASAADRDQWKGARESSLYHRLGGKAAIDAAVEAFYVKVLADARIKHYFDDINMTKQRRKQKEFLSAALGGPIPWTGKDLGRAHRDLPDLGDKHFDAVAENLKATLGDLQVPKALVEEVMRVVGTTRDAVLNRKPASK